MELDELAYKTALSAHKMVEELISTVKQVTKDVTELQELINQQKKIEEAQNDNRD